jgi:hypothetical protein
VNDNKQLFSLSRFLTIMLNPTGADSRMQGLGLGLLVGGTPVTGTMEDKDWREVNAERPSCSWSSPRVLLRSITEMK